jgi:alkylresorcinol/alkylpyrone synthase
MLRVQLGRSVRVDTVRNRTQAALHRRGVRQPYPPILKQVVCMTSGSNGAAPWSAHITDVVTAVPPHTITLDDVRYYLGRVFDIPDRRVEAMMTIIENVQVRRRHAIFPIDYTIQPRPLSKTNEEYIEHSVALGQKVAEECLARTGVRPEEVDALITVSCTGYMIPSMDAHLLNRMGFRPDVRRMPFTELGCVAGAVALSRAADYLKAYPDAKALVISVELPSLTFQRKDISQANLISAVLFGDGAAAALVKGAPGKGPRIVATQSHTVPNTLGALGFDLRDTGFHIVLSKDVPDLLKGKIRDLVDGFLKEQGLEREQIKGWLLHPGGARLLENVEEELGIPRSKTQISWDVLSSYGNLSSATVLFILKEWMEKNSLAPGDFAIAAGFGPGFSTELLLLQWT